MCEVMLPIEVSVVRREDDHRVIQLSLPLDGLQNLSKALIYSLSHSETIDDRFIVDQCSRAKRLYPWNLLFQRRLIMRSMCIVGPARWCHPLVQGPVSFGRDKILCIAGRLTNASVRKLRDVRV